MRTLNVTDSDFSLGIHLIDEAESARLNLHYREKTGPTNILSFPASQEVQLPPGEPVLLGDLALCIPVLEAEARQQHKSLTSHFAHLTVHGVLHLNGHDHEEEAEARLMEQLETEILGNLGFADPYAMPYTAPDK